MRTDLSDRSAKLTCALMTVVLTLAACSGGAGLSAEQNAAVATAEDNAPELQLTRDFATTQMLDTRTGTIASLDDIVTGDRPVLLWYWAPN